MTLARRAVATLAASLAALAAAACAPAARPSADTPPSSRGLAPPVKLLTRGPTNGNGDIFVTPRGGGYPSGPEILTVTGKVVWFKALAAGTTATDFRTQTYRGKPVLTWCQGLGPASPNSWSDVIYNDHYQEIAQLTAGPGYSADYHEFLITPWNTALITANRITTANLTAIGGPADQSVVNDVVQEIDISTGKVLFQWDSAAHVPYQESHFPRPPAASVPWDWFHINAVHLDEDGNLLINSRFTWATYKVSLRTGKIIWTLGGKRSTFAIKAAPGQVLDHAGEIFAYQHDPEAIGHDEYTFFDDEDNQSPGTIRLLPYSRAVVVRLNLAARTATLVRTYNQPEHKVSIAEGNAQTTRNGDLFVGWGTLPYISEFTPAGKLLFNARFPPGVSSYRAYRLPWPSAPT